MRRPLWKVRKLYGRWHVWFLVYSSKGPSHRLVDAFHKYEAALVCVRRQLDA